MDEFTRIMATDKQGNAAQASGISGAEAASQAKVEFVTGEGVQCPECFHMNRATEICEFMICNGAYCGALLTPP